VTDNRDAPAPQTLQIPLCSRDQGRSRSVRVFERRGLSLQPWVLRGGTPLAQVGTHLFQGVAMIGAAGQIGDLIGVGDDVV
jgi:hypothetical protein